MEPRRLEAGFRGRVPYEEGLRLQEARWAAVREERAPEAMFLLEHPPVVTLGRNARREHIVAPAEALSRMGIAVHECGRGGDVTYHGPGQLVGYPIVNLAPDRKDVGKYVRTLAGFGVKARRIPGLTGVWVRDAKIAAIGVRIARWVTSHGFALNVTTDLGHFDTIVPCGIRNHGVTSLERLGVDVPPLPGIARTVAAEFATLFDRELDWTGPAVTVPVGASS